METLKKYHKIVILKGGISDEYEISKLTANQVSETLKPLSNVKTINVEKNSKSLIEDLIKLEPDVVFNCLHGYFGEDGQVQSILNYLKIPYTHSGVLTSAILMNKLISKQLFISKGIRTPINFDIKNLKREQLLFPLIIKPINGGSSNGLFKINNFKELNTFILDKKVKLNKLMLEEYINGRELTVGILENKICGIMEIKFNEEIYDYENKYINIAKHIIDPKLPQKIKAELINISLEVHNSFNCNCISRIDFRYDEDNQKVFLLEVNTQPGLTKNSLLPEMAKKKGINFLKLCKILIKYSKCEN